MDIEKYIKELEKIIEKQDNELDKYEDAIDEAIYKIINRDYSNALRILLNLIDKDYHSDYLLYMAAKNY